MAERLLHEMDRRAAIKAVTGVSMAQPVGRDLGGKAGPRGGCFDDAVDGARPG